MTESSAGSIVNRPDRNAVGAVGTPLPGTEAKIADDGELLLRGPGVMRGYQNLPEQTAEVMLADGWLATGDIARIDDHGRVLDHRPQEGPDQDLRRQVHGAEPDRGAARGAVPVAVQRRGARRGAQLRLGARDADPDATSAFGEAEGISGTPED